LKNKILEIFNKVKKSSRDTLFEHEVYEVFKIIGINTPIFKFISLNEKIKTLEGVKEVVVKVVSKDILHKTELGGVIFCNNNVKEISEAVGKIKKLASSYDIEGFLIVEKLSFKSSFGREIIASAKNSKDFSTYLGFGVGGLDTEFFGKEMKNSFNIISGDDDIKTDDIKNNAVYYKLAGLDREKNKLLEDKTILDTLNKLKNLAKVFSYEENESFVITECEINPLVVNDDKLFAIDGILKIEENSKKETSRPIEKLENLFKPKSIAFIGVSEKSMNMGRIILNNVIKRNFNKENLFIIKPGTKKIDGVKCYENVKALPKKIDLLVLAVSSNVAGNIIKESINEDKFESIIVIPGGFAETSEGKVLEKEIIEMINESRKTKSKGPILVGGNCLGVISNPGNYDTFFIPSKKMNYSTPLPYAFVSQSGAFVISKISKTNLTPYYAASIGNQMDLRFSDYLSYFIEQDEIKTVAVYIEGFKNLDGIKTARVIKKLKQKGKNVIVYKGGRSSAGKSAASGHTASIAGDYKVYKSIIEKAGAFVTENFTEFESVLKFMVLFDYKKIKGNRVSVISNAGFETVGMADNLSNLELPKFSKDTKNKIKNTLAKAKIDKLVSAENPLDVTPVASDYIYLDCIKHLLEDSSVDFGIVSCIPMTPAIKSIEEELDNTSMFYMINELGKNSKKPFIVIVDSGSIFDKACSLIESVPVFRESDDAIKFLSKYIGYIKN
jgi:acyl-CoA synthetase (NDP forming)